MSRRRVGSGWELRVIRVRWGGVRPVFCRRAEAGARGKGRGRGAGEMCKEGRGWGGAVTL